MKKIICTIFILMLAACAQNKIPQLNLTGSIDNKFNYLENLQFTDDDLVITVYSNGGFAPQTKTTHTVFRKGNVEQVWEEKMIHQENVIKTIQLTDAQKQAYIDKINSREFQEFLKTTPADFDAKIDYKECKYAVADAHTEGIIITQNGKQNHYKKYAPGIYLKDCDMKNKQLLQDFYNLIQDFKAENAQ